MQVDNNYVDDRHRLTGTELYKRDILEGHVERHKMIYKFGDSVLGNNTEEVVMQMSTPANEPDQLALTSNQALRIKAGGDAADVATTGTGARTVTIYGLNENYEEVSAVLLCNGISASTPTSSIFIRCWRARVSSAGSGKVNAADIIIETTAGVEMCIIPIGLSQTQVSFWTVPAQHRAIVHRVDMDVDGNKTATVKYWIYNGAAAEPVKRCVMNLHGVSGHVEIADQEYHTFMMPQKTDVWFTGQIAGGGEMSTIMQIGYYK